MANSTVSVSDALKTLSFELATRSSVLLASESFFLILVNAVSLVGNVLVCLAVFRNHRLRTIPNMFVVALAISDVAMAVFSMPLTASVLIAGRRVFTADVCVFQGFCAFHFAGVSLQTLCVISISRYFCVLKPNRYRNLFTVQNTCCFIILSWCIASVFSLPPLFLHSQQLQYTFHPGKAFCMYSFESNMIFTVLVEVININVPLAIMNICYSKVYRAVKNANKTFIQNNGEPSNVQLQPNVVEAKVTKTLFAVLMGFAACWMPIFVIDVIDMIKGAPELPRQLYLVYGFLAYTSSAINPFIYGIRNRAFRREFARIVCFKSTSTVRIGCKENPMKHQCNPEKPPAHLECN